MTTDPEPELASECRALLEAWLRYFDGAGHSHGLKAKTEEMIKHLPAPESASVPHEHASKQLAEAKQAIADFLKSCTDGSDNYVGGVERLKLEAVVEKVIE